MPDLRFLDDSVITAMFTFSKDIEPVPVEINRPITGARAVLRGRVEEIKEKNSKSYDKHKVWAFFFCLCISVLFQV
jgi:hypothetical protein